MKANDQIGENLEQSQETVEPAHAVKRAELESAQKLAAALVTELGKVANGRLVGEIVESAIKLLSDQTNRGDIKLINKSLKELRYAMKVFAPYREVRKASIFGSARTQENHEDYLQAARFAKAMVNAGWMVITAAGGGIMAAGHGGAGPEPSFGLAIRLPHEQAANPTIANDQKLINFKYFFTRKLMFVRSAHAVAAFPGGFGTMDEAYEVLTLIQTGKSVPLPIVLVDHPGGNFWKNWQQYAQKQLLARGLIDPEDMRLMKITDDIDEAVHELTHFYHNFHSVRYWKEEIIIRLNRVPSAEQLAQLARDFADIKVKGEFRICEALSVERDEPTLTNLPRLVFAFDKRSHGRLRMLIDAINDWG